MASLDRRGTFVYDAAIKTPVKVATTAAITLSGLQTIDGVVLAGDERVLVKNQADASQNGIYAASSGNWQRTTDASGNTDFVAGSQVFVAQGTLNAGLSYAVTTTDSPIVIGTSDIDLLRISDIAAQQQSATSTTSLTIGTGAKTLAVQAGKAFVADQWVLIQQTSAAANQMLGTITSYSGTSLVVGVTATGGSGTHADWTVVLTNSPAAAGYQPPVGSGNVTGPGGSTADHIATFADASGQVLKDGGVIGLLANLNATTALTQGASAIGYGLGLINGTLSAAVGSNALTISIKTLAGDDPSAADPVLVVFRNATAATGNYVAITLTAATSLVISSTSLMGTTNGVPFRLWVVGFNDGGTFRLGAVNCSTATQIYPLVDGLNSSTAEGGAGGADSAGVIYTGTTVTSKPMRILGHLDFSSGQATAGAWVTAPDIIQLFGPGIGKPGDLVQKYRSATGAVDSTTVVVPLDDTIPQSGEGKQFFAQAITPTSKINHLRIEASAFFSVNAADYGVLSIFQDAGAAAVATGLTFNQGVGGFQHLSLNYETVANTLSSTTFKIIGGPAGANTLTLNGQVAARKMGGALNSLLEVSEIQG